MRRIAAAFTNHSKYTYTSNPGFIDPLDPATRRFVELYGITDQVETDALDTLVGRLKVGAIHGSNLWSDAIGVYPITIKDHASSLGNIRDTTVPLISKGQDASHSANGLEFTGGKYYGFDFDMATVSTPYSATFSVYLASEYQSFSAVTFGAFDGANFTAMYPQSASGECLNWFYGNSNGHNYNKVITKANGLLTHTIRDKTTFGELEYYQGTQSAGIVNTSNKSLAPTTVELFFMARNNNDLGADNTAMVNEARFAYIGREMSANEVADLDFAVTEYQTTLGRNI